MAHITPVHTSLWQSNLWTIGPGSIAKAEANVDQVRGCKLCGIHQLCDVHITRQRLMPVIVAIETGRHDGQEPDGRLNSFQIFGASAKIFMKILKVGPLGVLSFNDFLLHNLKNALLCPMTKCPMTKCPVTKCPMTKCPMTKCPCHEMFVSRKVRVTKCPMT